MRNEISNSDNTIDSRDVIKRIEDLESERDALVETKDELANELKDFHETNSIEGAELEHSDRLADLEEVYARASEALDTWDDSDEGAELKALQALTDECEGYASDWHHGAQLIRDSYFENYAQELADDLGLMNQNASWPYTCIDWTQASTELQMDYTAVYFDGTTYWVR